MAEVKGLGPNLIVTSDTDDDRIIPITRAVTTIGRAPDRDVPLLDRKASAHHAEIRVQPSGLYTIHDLDSTNGTYLNGLPIQESVLKFGDEVTIGQTVIIFTDKASPGDKTQKMILTPEALGAAGRPSARAHGDEGARVEVPLADVEKRFFREIDGGDSDVIDVAQKLKVLSRLSTEVNTILEVDELLERVMDIVLEVVPCDRAFILLLQQGKLVPKVVRRKAGLEGQKGLQLSTTILSRALAAGHGVLTRDARSDPDLRESDSAAFLSLRSAITAPLKVKESILGVVHLDKVTAAPPFEDEDLEVLGLICNQAASNLANAQLVEELRRTNAALRDAKEDVLRWNLELEQKVDERTGEVVRISAEKDELLGMVAHDLRTPITAIYGFTDVLLQHLDMGADPELIREAVETIARISSDMSDLLNDLLDVTKIEAGKLHIQRERKPIAELIDACRRTWTQLTAQRGLRLELRVEEGIPPVPHDARRIGQVLYNLVANAVKFSRAEDTITISARRDADAVEVSIADTGPGIPAEELTKLFKRFEQASTKASRGEAGFGLGLSIARKLIELHGGRIWVESEKGVGTKFTFSLPLH